MKCYNFIAEKQLLSLYERKDFQEKSLLDDIACMVFLFHIGFLCRISYHFHLRRASSSNSAYPSFRNVVWIGQFGSTCLFYK